MMKLAVVSLVLAMLAVHMVCAVPLSRVELQEKFSRLVIKEDATKEEMNALCLELKENFPGLECEGEETQYQAADIWNERHSHKPKNVTRYPVVLLPGLGGSGLLAKMNKPSKPAWHCFRKWGWWQVWLQVYQLLFQSCLFDNLEVHYNSTTNQYANTNGVQIQARDFGGLSGIDKLDHFSDPFGLTKYYAPMIKQLKKIGYRAGKNLFGAPFDWRLPVDFLMSTDINGAGFVFEEQFKALIERAYTAGGDLPVNLVTHSMGGPTALYFLNRQSRDWKTKYVRSFVPIAGPWAGSADPLRAMISGSNFGAQFLGISLINLKAITQVARQAGGPAYMLPNQEFWPTQQIFVSTPSKNYTSGEFFSLFTDVGTPVSGIIASRTARLIDNLRHPEINNVYCLYGYNMPTDIGFDYPDFPSDPTKVNQPTKFHRTDLGDGTVPLLSLQECKSWTDDGSPDVNCKEYDLRGHTEILRDDELFLDVLEIVTDTSSLDGCEQTPKLDEAIKELGTYPQKPKDE